MGILGTKYRVCFQAIFASIRFRSPVSRHVLTRQPTTDQLKHDSFGGMFVEDVSLTGHERLNDVFI